MISSVHEKRREHSHCCSGLDLDFKLYKRALINIHTMRPGLITVFFTMIFNGIFAQVNLQTGAAEQSFPLINYVDSKSGLTLGVSANYSSGNGLLVNSLASDLGTGWSLDAGGVISRVQVGQPDDQPEFDNGQL